MHPSLARTRQIPARPCSLSSIRGICLLITALGGALAAPGCLGNRPEEAVTANAPYEGPPLSIVSTGGQHRIIMTAPTSGWTITLDGVTPRLNHTDIFITIVRPNPAFTQTQALINQEVGSSVDTSEPIEAFARILEFGEDAADQPYHGAGRSQRP